MSSWQSNASGYSFDYNYGSESSQHDYRNQYFGEDRSQFASHHPPPDVCPPPPKAARTDFDQTPCGGPTSYQGMPTSLMGAGPSAMYDVEGQYSHYSQSGGGSNYQRQQQSWNQGEIYPPPPPPPPPPPSHSSYESESYYNARPSSLMATDPFAGFEESTGPGPRGPHTKNSGQSFPHSHAPSYDMPPGPPGFRPRFRPPMPPMNQLFPPHGAPMQSQMRPFLEDDFCANKGGGRFSKGRKKGPVSLLDSTFAPPAGLPMQVKREKSITRWARATRQEWPERERKLQQYAQEKKQPSEKVPMEAGALQVTSFLSEMLQRELRKNMTFLYGSLRDIAVSDRGNDDEFYPKDAEETSVIVDLCYDDVFVAQGCGSQRFEARENASLKALQLFLRDKVYVVGCYRHWDGEKIPGFCVSNNRSGRGRLPPYPRNPKRERDLSEKPDSKKLPWLQVNPSSNLDMSYRLKPKSMKDFFILINGRGDDYNENDEKSYRFTEGFPRSLNAVAVVNNSAQFNQMKVEYRPISLQHNGRHRCVILMDKQEVATGDGNDAAQARRFACEKLLADLSGKQPVARMQLDRAVSVSRDDLEGWAKKLAEQKLPWVAEMNEKLDPPNPMKEPHLQSLMDDAEAYLKEYVHYDRPEPLKFGADFTHDERMAIHKAARRLGLASKPYGPQWRLYQVVSHRFSLLELKQMLIKKKVAGRYALVDRGTADLEELNEDNKVEENENESGNHEEVEKNDGNEPTETDDFDSRGSWNVDR